MQLGVLIDTIEKDQKSIMTIDSLNRVSSQKNYIDTILFYINNKNTIIKPNFALMNSVEIFGFKGISISTNILTSSILIKSFGPVKKFFYVWDLEWTNSKLDINKLVDIYNNPEIELIARSKDHADLITKCWRKPVAIIENFNHEKIIEFIKSQSE